MKNINMPIKKVLLHIGIGKTGTSSIQDMLFQYRHNFKELGVYYPEDGLFQSAHHRLANLPGRAGKTQPIEHCLKKIKEDFLNGDCNTLVISSENLCYTTQETISAYYEILSDLDVTILMYIRRQDELLQSAFLEWVKKGWDYKENLNGYFNQYGDSFLYTDRLLPWSDTFGESNIKLRLYDKRVCPDVCADFLKQIDIKDISWEIKKYNSNPSIPPQTFPVLALLDKLSIQEKDRKKAVDFILHTSKTLDLSKGQILLSDEFTATAYEKYHDSNLIISDRYFSEIEKKYFMDWSNN